MRRYWWLALALVVATLYAYGPLGQNGFIGLDDPEYVTKNPHVLAGLTSDGFAWAFNLGYTGNWHPLTWLSHMLDVSWWGLDPAMHHAVNLALHTTSVVVLFLLLLRTTDRPWASAFVAAVFAVHPMHVESVAWAAERKDVLSTLLGFLSIACWVDWTKKGGAPRYLGALALFGLSLSAKPMFVTLPFLLLLLDRWPLARAKTETAGLSLAERIREKLPYFAFVLASCVLTVISQQRGRAMSSFDRLSLDDRFGNALAASFAYLEKAFWPTRLAVFYPHPFGGAPAYQVLGGSLVLAVLTFAAFRYARRLPWLAFGWLWWLGMLVPVIGVVQVGGQSMADRYTYAPMVGLSIVVAWGAGELAARQEAVWGKAARVVAAVVALGALGACIAATRVQVGYWKDDPTLFQHALDVTERNYLAHFRLGADAWEAGRRDEGLGHYAETVRLAPDMPEAHNNYGAALLVCGRTDEAIVELAEAVRTEPDVGDAYINLAGALLQKGRVEEAIPYLKEGVRLRPDLENMRQLLEKLQQSSRAK